MPEPLRLRPLNVPEENATGDALKALCYRSLAGDTHFLAFADWLMQRGDPLGDRIALFCHERRQACDASAYSPPLWLLRPLCWRLSENHTSLAAWPVIRSDEKDRAVTRATGSRGSPQIEVSGLSVREPPDLCEWAPRGAWGGPQSPTLYVLGLSVYLWLEDAQWIAEQFKTLGGSNLSIVCDTALSPRRARSVTSRAVSTTRPRPDRTAPTEDTSDDRRPDQ